MVSDVLSRVEAPDLRAYVVWAPVLASDTLPAARLSAAKVTDSRVTQFWDEDLLLGFAMGETLRIPVRPRIGNGRGVAWDVYLLYPPGPTSQAEAMPAPAVWVHQLSHLPPGFAPRLEGADLEQRLRALAAGR